MQLTQSQIDQFRTDGYLVVRNVLAEADLDPVLQEYAAHIDRRARELHAAGTLSDTFAHLLFEQRLARITEEDPSVYAEMDIMAFRGEAIFEFLRNDHLMDLVEGLVGPEILCSPIQHVRAKLPEGLAYRGTARGEERAAAERRLAGLIQENVAPWHQDAQVSLEDADPHFIVTVWIPMCDATPENGCLQVIPRAHRTGLVYWSEGFGISLENLPSSEIVTLPMDKGDVLLMDKLTPHGSTVNQTDSIRWSMDLRYQKVGTATGRGFYPAFVARSRAHPEERISYAEWARRWEEAIAALAPADRPRRSPRLVAPAPLGYTIER